VVEDAITLFRNDKQAWLKLMDNAMDADYSWDASARRYAELYQKAVELNSSSR